MKQETEQKLRWMKDTPHKEIVISLFLHFSTIRASFENIISVVTKFVKVYDFS